MESYRSNSRMEHERRNRRNRGETQWGRRADYERDVVDPFEGQEPVEEWEVGDSDYERRRLAQERYPARGQSRFDRGFEDLEDWQKPRQFGQGQGWDQGTQRRFGQDRPERYDSPFAGGSGYGRESYGQNPYGRSSYSGQGAQTYGSERFGTRQPYGSGRHATDPERYGRERAFDGGHAGKGPKGYQRSDERIREDLSDRLTADPEIDASDISISVHQGEVTLEGSVCDRSMKRAAEDLSEEVAGVREVSNRLRVEKADTGSQEGAGKATTTPSGFFQKH